MLSYSEAKRLFIEGLTQDAIAHEGCRFQDVGIGFDDLDARLPRGHGSEFDKLFIALNFWDGWIDARNHDWQYYKGIQEGDWPRLARGIVEALSADREISEPIVLAHFDLRQHQPSKGVFRRLFNRIWT